MIIGLADAVKFISMAVVMGTVFLANQHDGYIGPSLAEKSGKYVTDSHQLKDAEEHTRAQIHPLIKTGMRL
jgi:hypothetical protein